MKDSEEEGNRS